MSSVQSDAEVITHANEVVPVNDPPEVAYVVSIDKVVHQGHGVKITSVHEGNWRFNDTWGVYLYLKINVEGDLGLRGTFPYENCNKPDLKT